MKVLLYFVTERQREIRPVYVLYGRFSRAGFLFVKDKRLIQFGTTSGRVFEQLQGLHDAALEEEDVELLLLSMSEEEAHRILRTCEACASSKIPFNLRDLVLMYLPLRNVRDTPLFEVETLNHAQSIILILRECLEKDHELQPVLAGLHSRQTFVETLYQHLLPYAQPLVRGSVLLEHKTLAGH